MSDLAAIATRHVVIDGHCQGDGPGLPCDVVPLLDELAALRSQRDTLAAGLNAMMRAWPGHYHWDHTMRFGAGCTSCEHWHSAERDNEQGIALARSIEP